MSKRGKILKAFKAAIDNLVDIMREAEDLSPEDREWVGKKMADYQAKLGRIIDKEQALRQEAANASGTLKQHSTGKETADDLPF